MNSSETLKHVADSLSTLANLEKLNVHRLGNFHVSELTLHVSNVVSDCLMSPWNYWFRYFTHKNPPPCREAPVECHNAGVRFPVLGSGILELFCFKGPQDLFPDPLGAARMTFLQVCFCFVCLYPFFLILT